MPRPSSLRPPAVVVSDPEILGGWPVVKGTRVASVIQEERVSLFDRALDVRSSCRQPTDYPIRLIPSMRPSPNGYFGSRRRKHSPPHHFFRRPQLSTASARKC